MPTRSHRHRSLAWLLLALPCLGSGPCSTGSIRLGLPSAAGLLPVEIALAPGASAAATTVTLDGVDVTALFAAGPPGLLGAVPVPDPGTHTLQVVAPIPGLPLPSSRRLTFRSPGPAPALLEVSPPESSPAVARGAWLRFRFASPAHADALEGFGFGLECNGQRLARSAHPTADGALVLNPSPALPAGASCRVVWRDEAGDVAEHAFNVAADAGAAVAFYDRRDPLALAPFPDDFFTRADASQPSGLAIEPPVPPFDDAFQQEVFAALGTASTPADGWSRATPVVLAFSHPLDPSAIPANGLAAQDPLAPVSLVDVDPASPDFGKRIAYHLVLRTDDAPDGTDDHVAILYPGIDLRERGRYAVVVRRQAFASGTPGRGVEPSPFLGELLAPAGGTEDPELARARELAEPTLAVLASLPGVPIPAEDVALVVRISARTKPSPDDLRVVKELALASPPPALVLPNIAVNPCPNATHNCIRTLGTRALEVRGHIFLPDFRDGATSQISRDPISGLPIQTGTNDVRFVLTLPRAALDGPALPVMYQHGNPGSAPEVLSGNNEVLDDTGFAVVGFTDALNREFGQDIATQVLGIFFLLNSNGELPASWFQTTADQIFFLRAIQGMGSLDVLRKDAAGNPAVGPDGIPDIDPSRLLYKGISEGANNAQRFLPFAPELVAAEATVGGARLGETLKIGRAHV